MRKGVVKLIEFILGYNQDDYYSIDDYVFYGRKSRPEKLMWR